MLIARREAGGGENVANPVEAGQLLIGLGRGIVARRGEVRHQALESRGVTGGDGAGQGGRVFARAKPAHARVEGQVVGQGARQSGGHPVVVEQLGDGVDTGREFEVDQGGPLEGQKVAHDENARSDARLAQGHPLLHVADREPASTLLSQNARDFHCAVAVGVGFDDWHDLHARADRAAHGMEIFRELAA